MLIFNNGTVSGAGEKHMSGELTWWEPLCPIQVMKQVGEYAWAVGLSADSWDVLLASSNSLAPLPVQLPGFMTLFLHLLFQDDRLFMFGRLKRGE